MDARPFDFKTDVDPYCDESIVKSTSAIQNKVDRMKFIDVALQIVAAPNLLLGLLD